MIDCWMGFFVLSWGGMVQDDVIYIFADGTRGGMQPEHRVGSSSFFAARKYRMTNHSSM